MQEKKKVVVVLNPISGIRKKADIPALLEHYLDPQQFEVELQQTQSADHAKELSRQAVLDRPDMIVGAGGDGTLNLVAGALVDSGIPLGIIPLGSGNGFARALQIPLEPVQAIQLLNHGITKTIDTGSANGIPFINVCGLGFDAHVSEKFATAGTRGFNTYARISINEIATYREKQYRLRYDGMIADKHAFILAVCNGPQYGSNAFISPLAEFSDGWFDVTLIRKVNWWNMLPLAIGLFAKNIHRAKSVEHFRIQEITVEQHGNYPVNIDGEAIRVGEEIRIRMHPQSLKIICNPT